MIKILIQILSILNLMISKFLIDPIEFQPYHPSIHQIIIFYNEK